MSRTITVTQTNTKTKTPSPTPKTIQRTSPGRKLNNRVDIKSQREQLVNTYLTFTYEMRPGMENRIFWKYVALMLYSIDRITGTATNNNRNATLYSNVNKMTGIVSDAEQVFWSNTFLNILKNIKRINASTTRPLYNRLPKI
jgi:hypothetical protein